MRAGWSKRSLGDVATIYNGNSINAEEKKKKYLGQTQGLPFIATKDISNDGVIDYDNGVRIPNYTDFKIAHPNSVFVCAEGGSAGKKMAFVEQEVCFGNKLFALQPKKALLNGRYLYYFVQSQAFKEQFKQLITGIIGGVSSKKFKEIPIILSPLPEQQRIVDILDQEFAKIDALKANAEKSLQAAKDLFQATLKKELEPKEGWSINRLGDICTITSSKRIYKNEYVPDGIPFYRTKEVKEISNGRPISVELYISRERYNEIKQKFGVPQPNDILVSAVGTIGEMMIVRDNSPFYFKDGNLVWLKGITNADPEYLRYYLQSVINQIKGMTIGAAYSALTIEKFQEMEVALAPSLLEQQAIVSQLDDLNDKCKNLQDNYQKTLALCDDLKQALLRKAFNGEL